MKRYLTSIQNAEETDTVERIEVDDTVEVYRLDGVGHEVVAEKSGEITKLGPKDARVSRKKDRKESAPVEVSPTRKGIEVSNNYSKNRVNIQEQFEEHNLHEGQSIEIKDDCEIKLGRDVKLRANVSDVDTIPISEIDEEAQATEEYPTEKPKDSAEALVSDQKDGEDAEKDPSKVFSKIIELVELSTKNDEINECRKHLKDLHNRMIETKVDDPDYEETKKSIKRQFEGIERLDKKGDVDEITQERKQDLEYILHNVKTMYVESE